MSFFETLLLVVAILAGLSIIWSTIICGITPMPSSAVARKAMLALSCETGDGPIYELGSGWGNVLIALAKQFPNRQIVGYEISFLPWLISKLLIKILGLKNVHVYRKNFLNADLSEASVIVCYLFLEVMEKLDAKLKTESSELKFVISNNFSLPNHTPVKTIQLNDFYGSPVYLYEWKG